MAVTSIEKSTPPMGAPKVDDTPTAHPTASICMRSGFERRMALKRPVWLRRNITRQHEMWTNGPSLPSGLAAREASTRGTLRDAPRRVRLVQGWGPRPLVAYKPAPSARTSPRILAIRVRIERYAASCAFIPPERMDFISGMPLPAACGATVHKRNEHARPFRGEANERQG